MKKLITLICLMLIVSMDSMAGTKTVFMKPNSNWKQDNAIFKLYMFNDTYNAWTDFSAVAGDDGYYQATFDDQYTSMILVRYNPDGPVPTEWTGKWNQSNDLGAPASDNLLYTIPEGADVWDNFDPNISNYYASITSVDVRYDLGGWSTSPLVLTETSTNVYTGVLTLTNTLADQNFKVVINGDVWIGTDSGATLVDEGSLVDATTDETNHNYILKNVEKTYKTYDITVQWTPARLVSNTAKYTITISGKDARSNETKTVTFVEGTNSWENVYAYVYYPVTSTVDSDAGYAAWSGQDITSSESSIKIGGTDYNVYTFSCKEYEGCPLKVIFNDGGSNQTAAFELVDGTQYTKNLPSIYVLAGNNNTLFPNGWDAKNSTQVLTDNGDGTYSYSIENKTLAAGTSFGFKVVDIANSALVWYPADEDVTYTVNDAATYDFDIAFDPNDENPVAIVGKRHVQIDAAGFTSFSSAHYLDWSTVENAAPYMATLTGETGNKKALLSKVTATNAGQGALIKGTPNAIAKPVIASVTNTFEGNLFVATDGTAISGSTDGSYNYVYSAAPNPGFYKLASNLDAVKANGAYLHTTEPLVEENAGSRISWIFDDEVTGINQIENTQPATVKNTVVYNLNGQRVMNPAKGLYIVNGKKVIIK